MGWGTGVKNESAKRGGKEGRERKKYETKEEENEVSIGWHLLRYLAFPFAHIFPPTVLFLLPSASPSPLRHSATPGKFIFVMLRFFWSHPTFLASSLQAPVTGLEAWAEAHAHPKATLQHPSPKERPGMQAILALGSHGPKQGTPNLQCVEHPLGVLLRSHQPTPFATHE